MIYETTEILEPKSPSEKLANYIQNLVNDPKCLNNWTFESCQKEFIPRSVSNAHASLKKAVSIEKKFENLDHDLDAMLVDYLPLDDDAEAQDNGLNKFQIPPKFSLKAENSEKSTFKRKSNLFIPPPLAKTPVLVNQEDKTFTGDFSQLIQDFQTIDKQKPEALSIDLKRNIAKMMHKNFDRCCSNGLNKTNLEAFKASIDEFHRQSLLEDYSSANEVQVSLETLEKLFGDASYIKLIQNLSSLIDKRLKLANEPSKFNQGSAH